MASVPLEELLTKPPHKSLFVFVDSETDNGRFVHKAIEILGLTPYTSFSPANDRIPIINYSEQAEQPGSSYFFNRNHTPVRLLDYLTHVRDGIAAEDLRVGLSLTQFQRLQRRYDEEFWHHESTDEDIRHITLHMGKLLGKLAAYAEATEHGEHPSIEPIRTEVAPDLAFYAFHLANALSLDLGQRYIQRLIENLSRNREHYQKK